MDESSAPDERHARVPKSPRALARHAPWALLFAASFLFRLPPLKNAADLNSDVAIVGLQAMHILRGEWSPLLLGSTYQTSVDSTIAAGYFALFGATPLALLLSALVGHVLLTWFAYAVLARHLGRGKAAWLAALLVFTSATIHSYALYPPRQASLTLVFAGLYVLDRAPQAKRPLFAFGLGGALVTFACFADPYAFVLAPPAGLLGLLAAFDDATKSRASRRAPSARTMPRVVATALGALLGGAPLLALLTSPGSRHGEVTMSLDAVRHNAELLVTTCGPWALSTEVYRAEHMMDYAPWAAPPVLHALQLVAAAMFLVGLLSGGALFFDRRVPWGPRRLGLVGFAALVVNVVGFLLSSMVMDHFSMRYLAALLLFAPFALAPLAARVPTWRLVAFLAPYLVTSAIGGWVAYGPDVDGLALRPSSAPDDFRLGARLRAEGVHDAVADYWTAYRLTFLYREDPVVVPSHTKQDRYTPYRTRVQAARRFAYVIDPLRSSEPASSVEARLHEAFDATPGARIERIDEGRLTAFVVDTTGAAGTNDGESAGKAEGEGATRPPLPPVAARVLLP